MFGIGDIVVCGNNGVCVVEEIGPLTMMGKASKGREYYTLKPYYDSAGKVYLPVDSSPSAMRYALTKSEVEALMTEIDSLKQISITDEKQREAEYRMAVNSSDPRRLIRIIKTMYFRKQSRMENGKKSTAIDERYFRIAETRLYDEMALALGIEREEVRDYIRGYLENL